MKKNWRGFLYNLFVQQAATWVCFIASWYGMVFYVKVEYYCAEDFFAFKPIQTIIIIVCCASGIKLASMIGDFFGLRLDKKEKNNIYKDEKI